MRRIRARALVALLAVGTLVAGCGSAAAPSSSPSPETPSASTAPSATASAQPTATPLPTPTPAPTPSPDFLVGQVVVTVSDNLVVRSQPWVGADSEMYRPWLPLGSALTVIEGPVVGSGYTWYRVADLFFEGLGGPGYGWVAAAGKDGEPWIAPGRPGRGQPPSTVSRAGTAMTGTAVPAEAMDGRLRLSVVMTGHAPGEAVSLSAAGKYTILWICGREPEPCGQLGCGPTFYSDTAGTATAAARVVTGRDGTAVAQMEIAAAPPAESCPTDSSSPWATRHEQWENISIADPEQGLLLNLDTVMRAVTL